jgi:hypothetical protein
VGLAGRRDGVCGLSRRWYFAGVMVVAGAALAGATGSVAWAQSAPPATKPDQSDEAHAPLTKDQAKELFRSVDDILSFASTDTGLPIQHSVKRKLITRDEVNKYLREKFNDDAGRSGWRGRRLC